MCKFFYTFTDFDKNGDPKLQRSKSKAAARALLARAAELCGYSFDPSSIIVAHGGKPAVANGSFCFNISHCEGFVCAVISDTEVGVDAQRIGDVSDGVVRRFLKKEPSDPLTNTFFWTDYEALGKYIGCGIPIPEEASAQYAVTRFTCEGFAVSVCHLPHDALDQIQMIINVNLIET